MSEEIKCRECGHEYDPRKHNTTLPDNMHIWGVQPGEKVPQCPECDTADFMDTAARQLANEPNSIEENLQAINLDKPILEVSHAKLDRSGDSLYRSVCPVCLKGVLLMRRNMETLQLEEYDNCILCAQSVIYVDLADIGLV